MSTDAAPPVLRVGERTLTFERPLLMGVVNATPDSFSDDRGAGGQDSVGGPGGRDSVRGAGGTDGKGVVERRFELARELVAAGADIVDVGGESARTDLAPVSVEREIERVVPLIAQIVDELDVVVSVDTHKPAVAAAAIDAGATIVNDVSGLRDPALADICADTGAALVLMHTSAPPKQRVQDQERYDDIVAEVIEFLRERVLRARARGVAPEQLILDPGPDFTKTPAQTIALLADAARLHELGRPLLFAISRKDFIGALIARPPRERLAGTLAALAHGLDQGAHIFRVHDVAAAADFIAVRSALAGELEPPVELALADTLRHER